MTEISQPQIIDIKDLSFEQGAHLLIKKHLSELPVGGKLGISGHARELAIHLRGWCRTQGHEILFGTNGLDSVNLNQTTNSPFVAWIVRGKASTGRWKDAERAGAPDFREPNAIAERPPSKWGLAARGAKIEAGAPEFYFGLDSKTDVWAENVPRLYAQAAAAQWNPNTAIDWETPFELPVEIETAVVQVMTYLIENETAALLVPARFLAQIHPHFREVMQLLAIQVADEARHIEVFTRRATFRGHELGLSTVGGQTSLKTLFEEPDFTLSSFLLSVLGEGTFLNLLWFLEEHAPDPITRRGAQLAAQDEARHVAFGMGHLQYQISLDPTVRERLAAAVRRRFDALSQTTGLNEEVFDSLVILAAKEWTPEAISEGFGKVQKLKNEMHQSRTARLQKLGFSAKEAENLSSLHTKNFM